MQLQAKAFDIGRALGKHPLTSRLFCLVERFLPLKRLARGSRVVAFRHPRPSYDPHILVVPTMPFPTLSTSSLPVAQKAALLWEMIELAHTLATPSRSTWQMVINGGERQDIGQVHGHLIHARSNQTGMGLPLSDSKTNLSAWNGVFSRVEQAAGIPGNGYSVILNFQPDDSVTVVFSESLRS